MPRPYINKEAGLFPPYFSPLFLALNKHFIKQLLWQNTRASTMADMMIRHTFLALTDFSNNWGKCYINSFYIREGEQALAKGAVKAKICNAVEEEISVSENGTLNLTRKKGDGFQQQRTFHVKDYICKGLEVEAVHTQGAILLSDFLIGTFSTQTSFLFWHLPPFRP